MYNVSPNKRGVVFFGAVGFVVLILYVLCIHSKLRLTLIFSRIFIYIFVYQKTVSFFDLPFAKRFY